jgi:NAD(P)-dependent dehydrogenase (short-subunit alcohol dehydrogenase family)
LRVLVYRRYSGRRPVDLDDLMFADPERLGEPDGLRPFFAYGRTKSMNAMFVYALARRLGDSGVTINACHPGIIGGTDLSREVPRLGALATGPDEHALNAAGCASVSRASWETGASRLVVLLDVLPGAGRMSSMGKTLAFVCDGTRDPEISDRLKAALHQVDAKLPEVVDDPNPYLRGAAISRAEGSRTTPTCADSATAGCARPR